MEREETSITAASIISKSFDLKHACALTEEKFSHLAEDESASMSQGKQKIGKDRYTLLRKIYDIISSGGNVPKLNYTFHIDTIKVVSLMHHIQENIQLKDGRLRNVTIAGHKLKYIPVYECSGKGL